jgi:hypothetical protein
MRRRWACLAAVLLAAGAALAARLHKRHSPPALALPAADEVAEMRASLRPSRAGRAVRDFSVPAGNVPLILEHLRPAEHLREPWPLERLDELGEVAIRTKAGRVLWLWLYRAGRHRLVIVCTPDGQEQFFVQGSDGGLRLRKAVEDAFADSKIMEPW